MQGIPDEYDEADINHLFAGKPLSIHIAFIKLLHLSAECAFKSFDTDEVHDMLLSGVKPLEAKLCTQMKQCYAEQCHFPTI